MTTRTNQDLLLFALLAEFNHIRSPYTHLNPEQAWKDQVSRIIRRVFPHYCFIICPKEDIDFDKIDKNEEIKDVILKFGVGVGLKAFAVVIFREGKIFIGTQQRPWVYGGPKHRYFLAEPIQNHALGTNSGFRNMSSSAG